MGYLQQAADFVRQGVPSFAVPQLTDWVCTGTGGGSVSFDIADVATLGTTYVLPINLNIAAGTTEISLRHRTANLAVTMEGIGGGANLGLGWQLTPFSGSYSGGPLANIESTGGLGLPSGGIGCLVAGPKAKSPIISPAELEGFLTIGFSDVNFAVNGLTGGVAIFADRPILGATDLLYIKAFSLIWGIQLVGASVGAAVGGMTYKVKVRESSLPFPGARFGASVST